jgi:hypothetical protein
MAAPKENKYYLLRNRHGRQTRLTPVNLRSKALKYFFDMNIPGYKKGIPIGFHYTLSGMLRSVSINKSTFYRYEKKEGYIKLCKELRHIIHTNAKLNYIQK